MDQLSVDHRHTVVKIIDVGDDDFLPARKAAERYRIPIRLIVIDALAEDVFRLTAPVAARRQEEISVHVVEGCLGGTVRRKAAGAAADIAVIAGDQLAAVLVDHDLFAVADALQGAAVPEVRRPGVAGPDDPEAVFRDIAVAFPVLADAGQTLAEGFAAPEGSEDPVSLLVGIPADVGAVAAVGVCPVVVGRDRIEAFAEIDAPAVAVRIFAQDLRAGQKDLAAQIIDGKFRFFPALVADKAVAAVHELHVPVFTGKGKTAVHRHDAVEDLALRIGIIPVFGGIVMNRHLADLLRHPDRRQDLVVAGALVVPVPRQRIDTGVDPIGKDAACPVREAVAITAFVAVAPLIAGEELRSRIRKNHAQAGLRVELGIVAGFRFRVEGDGGLIGRIVGVVRIDAEGAARVGGLRRGGFGRPKVLPGVDRRRFGVLRGLGRYGICAFRGIGGRQVRLRGRSRGGRVVRDRPGRPAGGEQKDQRKDPEKDLTFHIESAPF